MSLEISPISKLTTSIFISPFLSYLLLATCLLADFKRCQGGTGLTIFPSKRISLHMVQTLGIHHHIQHKETTRLVTANPVGPDRNIGHPGSAAYASRLCSPLTIHHLQIYLESFSLLLPLLMSLRR